MRLEQRLRLGLDSDSDSDSEDPDSSFEADPSKGWIGKFNLINL